jgi:hypothetical protein
VSLEDYARAGVCLLLQEILNAGFCRGQGCAGLPLRDEFAVGEELREFLGDRARVRFVVARQLEARRLDLRDEGAVDAIHKAGGVGFWQNSSSTCEVASGWSSSVSAHPLNRAGAAGRHRADAADRLGVFLLSQNHAMRVALALQETE